MRRHLTPKFSHSVPAFCKDAGQMPRRKGGFRAVLGVGWRGRVALPHDRRAAAPWVVLLCAVWILVLVFVPLDYVMAGMLVTIAVFGYFRTR